MERRHLQCFLAVVESGSFTSAAHALHLAQPSLSHTIATLERGLGVRLFERLGRGVRLTAAGEALVEPARETLRAFDLARGAVHSVGETSTGVIRVVAPTLWAMEPLARIVGEFRRLHPAVVVTVDDPGGRIDVLDQLRAGEHDFGLVDGERPSGSLASGPLRSQRLVVVLPPRSLPGLTVASPEDLAPLGLISTPAGTTLHYLTEEFLGDCDNPPAITVSTAHLASVLPLVLAGAGAALVPEGLADEAGGRGARVLPLRTEMLVDVHLVWRRTGLDPLGEQFRALALTAARAGARSG